MEESCRAEKGGHAQRAGIPKVRSLSRPLMGAFKTARRDGMAAPCTHVFMASG